MIRLRLASGFILCLLFLAIPAAMAAEEGEATSAEDWTGFIAMAVALSVSIPCVSAGYAVARVGSASMAAAAERPDILGRALLFVALGEGIAILGFGIAFLLWMKI